MSLKELLWCENGLIRCWHLILKRQHLMVVPAVCLCGTLTKCWRIHQTWHCDANVLLHSLNDLWFCSPLQSRQQCGGNSLCTLIWQRCWLLIFNFSAAECENGNERMHVCHFHKVECLCPSCCLLKPLTGNLLNLPAICSTPLIELK